MTFKEMENIFKTEIPLNELVLDSGIYEFHSEVSKYNKEDIKSIGVSYECIDGKNIYYFNIFVNDQYIDIGEFDSIYNAIEDVTNEWNNY